MTSPETNPSDPEPISRWLRHALYALAGICLTYAVMSAYGAYQDHRAERFLEDEELNPTDTSEMTRQEARKHEMRLMDARGRTDTGRRLKAICDDYYALHKKQETEESEAQVNRHCGRYFDYLKTGEDREEETGAEGKLARPVFQAIVATRLK